MIKNMESLLHTKIKKVLHFILILFLILLFRIWHLCVIQKESKVKEAKKPQKRTVLEQANRGAIYDRYGQPIAINRIRYRASIYYAHIRQIPSFALEKQNKTTIRRHPRKEHIQKLAKTLSRELGLDEKRIEDLIYSKAALLPHVPFIIKENISEKEYYRLKMLEKDLAGLQAELAPERFYPHGKAAADLIGYIGSISSKEYGKIANEIKMLEMELWENRQQEANIFKKSSKSLQEIKDRLDALKKQAYQVNDFIGKSGVEGFFEKELRGFHGHKSFVVDIQGSVLKEAEDRQKAIAGKTLHSTIILELQKYAEELLAKDEKERDGKSRYYDAEKKEMVIQPQPWIKGGAIVVLEPKSGEILTLATYPGFDPNDFSSKNPDNFKKRLQWLENTAYLQTVFDGQSSFTCSPAEQKLSWPLFIDIMTLNSPKIKPCLKQAGTIKKALLLQEQVETLLYLAKTKNTSMIFDVLFPTSAKTGKAFDIIQLEKELQKNQVEIKKIKQSLISVFGNLPNRDILFCLDLLRIAVYSPAFSDLLLEKIGSLSLDYYWDFSKKTLFLKNRLEQIIRPIFHQTYFTQFRKIHQKDFLIAKRDEEKENKLYPRPYLDYLDQMEDTLFKNFFQKNYLKLLTSWIKKTKPQNEQLSVYFDILNQKENDSLELDFLENATQKLSFEESLAFLKTVRSFNQLERPLFGMYSGLKKTAKEKDLAALFYPKEGLGYMTSFAYKQAAPLGSIFKLVPAWAALKKQYLTAKSNWQKEHLNPLSMIDTRLNPSIVGYSLDGKPYTRYYKGGRLPASSARNMGQIDLISAIEQSSNVYFALLAGEFLDSPAELLSAAKDFSFGSKTGLDLPAESKGLLPTDLFTNKTGLYSFAMGQHSFEATPLQTAVMLAAIANGGKILKPKLIKGEPTAIRKKIFLPNKIRAAILEGMDKVLWGEKGSARLLTIQKLRDDPALKAEYKTLEHEMRGKTSTAEFMYKMGLAPSVKAEKYKDVWFGGFSFKNGSLKEPELVVVVFLRYGNAGREAAPIAAQIIKKYRELAKQI